MGPGPGPGPGEVQHRPLHRGGLARTFWSLFDASFRNAYLWQILPGDSQEPRTLLVLGAVALPFLVAGVLAVVAGAESVEGRLIAALLRRFWDRRRRETRRGVLNPRQGRECSWQGSRSGWIRQGVRRVILGFRGADRPGVGPGEPRFPAGGRTRNGQFTAGPRQNERPVRDQSSGCAWISFQQSPSFSVRIIESDSVLGELAVIICPLSSRCR